MRNGISTPSFTVDFPYRAAVLLPPVVLAMVLLFGVASASVVDPELAVSRTQLPAPPDTVDATADTVAISSDTSQTLAAPPARLDTLDTWRVRRYLSIRRPSQFTPSFSPRRSSFYAPRFSFYQHEVTSADMLGRSFRVRERVRSQETHAPIRVDRAEYRQAQRQRGLERNWRSITEERRQARQRQDRSGVGVNIAIPGGQQSPFSTIFGTPEVDLRVTGLADINAGLNYRHSDQQTAVTGSPVQIDPSFKQDLRLGITGTIGDKLMIDVNWDTGNEFDFQNQVRLQYTGYEDEIIQRVEAGNVYLQTPSSLIRGGQSLFGIKSEMQLGGLQLTTIASQQEGQSGSLTVEGGAETTSFALKPTDYDDRSHFFLAYYFRNRWNDALADPPNVRLQSGFGGITDIEVWKLQTRANPDDENVRRAVAVVDLGEPARLLRDGKQYQTAHPDSLRNATDQYSEAEREQMRRPDIGRSFFETRGLRESDYEMGNFQLLERGRDYSLDPQLGYLSLRQRLQDNEALAVSFRYVYNGQTYQVGDMTEAGGTSGGINSDRIVLKLLRPAPPTQPASGQGEAAWHLELRNIYPLRGRNLEPTDFELDVLYDRPGQTASNTIAELTGQETLLHTLGLDRLNQDGARQPDNRFDFLPGFTIDSGAGLLIFPHLEPFGDRMEEVVAERASSPQERQELRDRYVFRSLYQERKQNAELDTDHDIYRIEGSYRGTAQEFYDLRALGGLVEGSVRVTSGGTTLQEGTDFAVDYQGGTVTILNENLLRGGRTLNIDYEQNALFNLQKKTLLGARADYTFSDDLSLGATVMRLSQRSPVDKYRIGEEPIANTIWGLDGALDVEPRWLTRAIDALPFVQTRAPSAISLSAEFAQLRPGHTRTTAYDRTRRELRSQDRDFRQDELGGISYIDDFQGFENTLSLIQPAAWQISSAPATYRPPGQEDTPPEMVADSLRMDWRGTLSWYQLNKNIVDDLRGKADVHTPEAARLIDIQEVFPNRDTRGEINTTLRTLDLYFDPKMRGPYNYTRELETFMEQPEHVWGGMARRLPEGYNDFDVQNIEFVEFIFKPFPENQQGDAGEEATLYLDLGTLSEDVIGNQRLSTEDGLSTSSFSPADFDGPFRLATGQQNTAVDIEGERTEDLGLDGLVSYDANCYDDLGQYVDCSYPEIASEHYQFRDFINALNQLPATNPLVTAEVARARLDPSADAYHHYDNDEFFENPNFFPEGATFQQRLSRYHAALELNSYEGQNSLATSTSLARGNTRDPDSEDLNRNGVLDTENSYFQYRIPLSRDSLEREAQRDDPDSYVVGEIQGPDGTGTGWYQVRIPIRRYSEAVGNIQDFSLVESMRIWTDGHEVPVTLRFAKMDLVGSQWRGSGRVPLRENELGETIDLPGSGDSQLYISSINNEENSDVYVPPPTAIIGQQQTATGVRRNAREQSMMLQVEDLEAGAQRAIYKTYGQGLNLLRYANLRMFAHLHGQLDDGTDLAELAQRNRQEARNQVRLFVRLGSNQTGDYYEYEQPLTPSRERSGIADSLWLPQENEMNLLLSALNQLKVARDNAAANPTQVFRTGTSAAEAAGAPDPEQFAPEGTRLAIKGTPSLQNVTTLVVGIRNASDPSNGPGIQHATLWLDELRVTDYDEESGWAALGNADIRLADLGRISANLNTQTDGFGSLSSSLSERQQNDMLNWGVTADFNADKLLPEQYGWQVPITVQMQSQTSTPRFAPNRGDVRLEEIFAQIDARTDLSEREKQQERQRALRQAQDHRVNRSITASLQKNGSDSWLLRNTLDGITLNYSFSSSDARSPAQRLNDNWRWNAGFQYRLTIDQAHTIRPLWFLNSLPLLGAVGNLQFNYAPRSVTFGSSAGRNYGQRQARQFTPPGAGPTLPERIRDQQNFSHDRRFSLQYNPFEFLNLTFDTNTDQSLNAVSADTLYTVYAADSSGLRERVFPSRAAADREVTSWIDQGIDAFRQDELRAIPTGTLLQRFFDGAASPRTNRYRQRFTASLRVPFLNHDALDWISLDDIGYQANFNWNNGAAGRANGAQVSNNVELRSGLTLHPQRIWERFGFYQRLQQQDDGPGFNPLGWLRQAALLATSIEDLSLTYTGSRTSRSSNVGRRVEDDSVDVAYSLLDAFRGDGPTLGYRFGIDRHIGSEQRILDPSLEVTDLLSGRNRLQARTRLAPSNRLQINLNWDLNWNASETLTYGSLSQEEDFRTSSGDNRSTTWAFGASYRRLFERQLEAFRDAIEHGNSSPAERVPMTEETLTEDFREAFTSGPSSLLDERGLLPFPLPAWNVNYTGLSSWPLLNGLTQSVTLRHAYNAEFSNNYRTNVAGAVGELSSFSVGGYELVYRRPSFRASGLTVIERYQPLVGLDVNWSGGLQTNVAWNVNNAYRLSTNNSQVTQNEATELTLSATYRQRGLDIPLLPLGRLNNQINLSLTLSLARHDEQRYSLRQALAAAAADPSFDPAQALRGDNVSPLRQTTRLAITPKIGYQFSNRVSADFVIQYERLDGDSRRPSYTRVDGGFNVRVSMSN